MHQIMLCGYPPFYDDSIKGQFDLIKEVATLPKLLDRTHHT